MDKYEVNKAIMMVGDGLWAMEEAATTPEAKAAVEKIREAMKAYRMAEDVWDSKSERAAAYGETR